MRPTPSHNPTVTSTSTHSSSTTPSMYCGAKTFQTIRCQNRNAALSVIPRSGIVGKRLCHIITSCKLDGGVIHMPISSICEGQRGWRGQTSRGLPTGESAGGYCCGENKGDHSLDVLETVAWRSLAKRTSRAATGTPSSIITAHPLLMRNLYRGTPCCKRASTPAGSAAKLAWRART